MTKIKNKELVTISKLLDWYKKNKRKLPWRKIYKRKLPYPFSIFISEFMLQQTTVATVVDRFSQFLNLWPNNRELSKTNENKILNFWSGLGYYSRAKNLLKSSKIIALKHNNRIPQNYDDLISLPGIGDYTAKAILGIAFNKPYMPVDANIERIIARIYGIVDLSNSNKKKIYNKSHKYISKNKSSDLIQAFMDYGSKICLPRNPNCDKCIIKISCISFKKKLTNIIPKKIQKKKKIKFTRAYLLINEKKEILIRRRSDKGMLPSMLEFPNDKWKYNKKDLRKDQIIRNYNKSIIKYNSIKYSFSHFDLFIDIYLGYVKKETIHSHKWIKLNNVNKIGFPTIMKKIYEGYKIN